jgi:hypothetical protein
MSKRSMFLGVLVAGMSAAMFGCVSEREPEEVEQPAKQPPVHAVAPSKPGKTAQPGGRTAVAGRPAGPNQMIGGGGRNQIATAVPPAKEETGGNKRPETGGNKQPETPTQSVQQVSPAPGSVPETEVPGGDVRHIHAPAAGGQAPAAEGAPAGQAGMAME